MEQGRWDPETKVVTRAGAVDPNQALQQCSWKVHSHCIRITWMGANTLDFKHVFQLFLTGGLVWEPWVKWKESFSFGLKLTQILQTDIARHEGLVHPLPPRDCISSYCRKEIIRVMLTFIEAWHLLGTVCVSHIISFNSHTKFCFFKMRKMRERESKCLLKVPQLLNGRVRCKCRLISCQSGSFCEGYLCEFSSAEYGSWCTELVH